MEHIEDTVTLKELCAIVVRRGKLILCVALIFGILLGTFRFIKSYSAAKSEEFSEEKIEERYQAALKSYKEKQEDLQEQLAKTEKKLDSQQEYNDNSLKMRIDPYDTVVSTINFSITVDPSAFSQVYLLEKTPVDYIVSRIQNQYLTYWNALDLKQTLTDCSYAGTADKYLREVVSLSSMNGGGLTLTAMGETPRDARELAETGYACLTQIQPTIEESSYLHTFVLITEVVKNSVDLELEELQRTNQKQITVYQDQIEAFKQELETLSEPQKETGYSSAVIAKETIRWCALGSAIGASAAIVWIFMAYVLCGYIESGRSMETKCSLIFLGSTVQKKDIWSRLADSIMGERVWLDISKQEVYLTENLKFYLPEVKRIAVASTLPLSVDAPSVQALLEALSAQGHRTQLLSTVCANPETISVIQTCDTVIFAERIGTSQWENFLASQAYAKRLEKPVCGVVTV